MKSWRSRAGDVLTDCVLRHAYCRGGSYRETLTEKSNPIPLSQPPEAFLRW